jgi:hypothetical protein
MNQLLIATNNQGKVRELHELLSDTGIELVTPARIQLDLDVLENGSTYAENAAKKASAFAQASSLIPGWRAGPVFRPLRLDKRRKAVRCRPSPISPAPATGHTPSLDRPLPCHHRRRHPG